MGSAAGAPRSADSIGHPQSLGMPFYLSTGGPALARPQRGRADWRRHFCQIFMRDVSSRPSFSRRCAARSCPSHAPNINGVNPYPEHRPLDATHVVVGSATTSAMAALTVLLTGFHSLDADHAAAAAWLLVTAGGAAYATGVTLFNRFWPPPADPGSTPPVGRVVEPPPPPAGAH
jgi:hypothetical protein